MPPVTSYSEAKELVNDGRYIMVDSSTLLKLCMDRFGSDDLIRYSEEFLNVLSAAEYTPTDLHELELQLPEHVSYCTSREETLHASDIMRFEELIMIWRHVIAGQHDIGIHTQDSRLTLSMWSIDSKTSHEAHKNTMMQLLQYLAHQSHACPDCQLGVQLIYGKTFSISVGLRDNDRSFGRISERHH
jgi:hypothetical protein